MIGPVSIRAIAWRAKQPVVLLYLAYAVIAGCTLHNYLSWQSVNVVLGIIALPIATRVQHGNKGSLRFAWVALVFAAIGLFLPVKTLLFLAIVFACFFITDSCVGKMNLLPVLVAGIISPVFQYASNVMSFPLRLSLTALAGSMMKTAGLTNSVAGNMIVYNGNEFSVDPACMGLNMLVVGLLLQIMLIAVFQKQYGLRLNRWLVLTLLGLCVAMNVVSNLFRIICLVFFTVLPGTLMHDVVGILCLLVYVVLPMIYITRWMVKRAGKTNLSETTGAIATGKLIGMHAVLLITIGLSAVAIARSAKATRDITAPVKAVAGFDARRVAAEIVKLENAQSLVYIKHISGFYSADHHPSICWKGSGYNFKQIAQQEIAGQLVYTAIMENGKDTLYTAWWYDNGHVRTTSQLTWRWNVLNGGKEFSLVNVTTINQQQLVQQVRQLLQTNILTPVL